MFCLFVILKSHGTFYRFLSDEVEKEKWTEQENEGIVGRF